MYVFKWFKNDLEDISLFCGVTDTSILTSGGFQSKGRSLACMRWIPQIHLLCDTCAEGQYGVQAFSTLVLAQCAVLCVHSYNFLLVTFVGLADQVALVERVLQLILWRTTT